MKIKSIVYLSLIIGSFVSCGTSKSALMKIEKGMNKREVTSLLGNPDYRRFNPESEEWEYIKTDPLFSEKTIIIVNFVNDKVAFLDSFNGNDQPNPPVAVYPAPPGPGRVPAHPGYSRQEREFQQLYDKVKNTPFKDDQLVVLKMGSKNKYFTCDQVVRLMSIYPFDDDRLEVLKILAPNISDGENFGDIIKALSFISSQETARKLLTKKQK